MSKLVGATVGERVVEAYTRAGLNRNRLSKLTGIDYAQIIKWEKGEARPSPDSLAAVAAHTGVSVDDLMGRDAPAAEVVTRDDANRFVEEWLSSSEAKGVTEDEKQQLRATQWGGTPMSHGVVREAWRAYREGAGAKLAPPTARKGRTKLAPAPKS